MLLKMKPIIKYYFLVEKNNFHYTWKSSGKQNRCYEGQWESSRRKGSNLLKETVDILKFGFMHDTIEVFT